MSHMVIYRSVDGKPGFQQTEDLSSAVEFVERLRNVEGVENARIYRLEQVNFRFQPYYQVHLDDAGAPTPPPSPLGAAAPSAPPPPAQPSGAQPPPPPPMSDVAPAVPTAAIAEAVAAAPSDPVPQGDSGPGSTPPPPPDTDAGNGIRRGLFGR